MAERNWNPPDAITHDDDTPPGFVLVNVNIDKLKKSTFGGKPNAELKFDFQERSFQMTCTFKGDDKPYFYEVKKLPAPVVANACRWKCEKGNVKIMLKKADDVPWKGFLMTKGLDHFDEKEASS